MHRVNVSEHTVTALLVDHDAGVSTLALAKTHNLTPKVVRRVLREHGRTEGRRPRVRDDLFVTPLTSTDAYWLGFLAADGYVNTNRGFARLKLSATDGDHVAALATYAGLSSTAVKHEVHSVTGNRQTYIDITGHTVVDRLCALGLTAGKTTRTVPPVDGNERHYMRGLVDADGCISGQRLSICCTPVHAQWLSTLLTSVFALPPRTAYEHMGIKRIYIPRTVTPHVLAWLYDDIPAHTALPRKLAAVKTLLNRE